MVNAKTLEGRFAQAMTLHQTRRYAEAELLYRELLASNPDNARLSCMLGALVCQTGRVEAGVTILERAGRLAPRDAAIQFNLANGLERLGRLSDASRCYERVLRAAPQDAEVHFRLGSVLAESGETESAIKHYRKAVDLRPGVADWYNALGVAYRQLESYAEAIHAYRMALRLNSKSAKTHYNLGIALQATGELEAAIAAFETADGISPGDPDIQNNLGHVLRSAGQLDKSLAVLERALSLHSDHSGIQINLANTLVDLNRVEESLPYYQAAIAMRPEEADFHASYAMALWTLGQYETAVNEYHATLKLDGQHPDAQFCLGLHALAQGKFDEGWRGYEYRWRSKALATRMRTFSQPAWKGESLAGKRLLIHAEQGLGDEIMFASVFPEIIRESEHCIIECAPKLEALFRRSFPDASIVSTDRSKQDSAVESMRFLEQQGAHDYQAPAGSVPRFRRRTPAEFPRHADYLRAAAADIGYWRSRLAALGEGLKVGISWRGGTARTGIIKRSLCLQDLLPVLRTPKVQFVSLQYTSCGRELQDFMNQTGIPINHWQDAIDDYDQTAALVSALDLTISVCTAVIHLAGALGRPVWVMAPAVPEWRYGLSGADMPWYPSVRIFRQQKADDWATVLADVAKELAAGNWSTAAR